jgi:acyl-CoA thioesterase-1
MRHLVLLSALLLAAGCGGDTAPDSPDAPAAPPPDAPAPTASAETDSDTLVVVFFGDSLTAGYGLENPAQEAYPALVGAQLAEAGLPVRVLNAGNSGETSAGGLSRVAWVVQRTPPDVFVLALGANDGLRGIDPEVTRENLGRTLHAVREVAPEARLVVAGMEALPNMGADYTDRFRAVFPAVAEAHGATLLPFLLDGVAGEAALNQADGVHPTAEGHRRMAALVAPAVEPLVRAQAGA